MEAVEYLKERKRMCHFFGKSCDSCLLDSDTCMSTSNLDISVYEDNVNAVEQWVKDHPAKTRQSELLKMYPKAVVGQKGIVDICPLLLIPNYCLSCSYTICSECCEKFWSEEVE